MTEKIESQADKRRLLTRQERDDVYDSIPVEDGGTVGAERLAFCKAQDAKSYAAGLAEGRGEVVDWIKEQPRECGAERVFVLPSYVSISSTFKPIIFQDAWQAKLKEWGIE